jgi:hypothetical protein
VDVDATAFFHYLLECYYWSAHINRV